MGGSGSGPGALITERVVDEIEQACDALREVVMLDGRICPVEQRALTECREARQISMVADESVRTLIGGLRHDGIHSGTFERKLRERWEERKRRYGITGNDGNAA